MINAPETSRAVSEDRVAAIAYALWLDEGQPLGRAEDHWFKALQIVSAEIPDLMQDVSEAAKPKRKAAATPAKKAAPRKRS